MDEEEEGQLCVQERAARAFEAWPGANEQSPDKRQRRGSRSKLRAELTREI